MGRPEDATSGDRWWHRLIMLLLLVIFGPVLLALVLMAIGVIVWLILV